MVVQIHSNLTKRRICAGAIACLVAMLATPPVQAQTADSVSRGQILSETWCSSCHFVSPTNRERANDGAPSFEGIARHPSTTSTGLRVFLQTPHPRMPNDVLSANQTDDIVAYILSLKR